jgi:hypothetical protein
MTEVRRFKVRQFIESAELRKDTSINPLDLSDGMMQQASLFSHYGELAAKAARQVDDVKLLLENTEAAVYRKLRDDFAGRGEKVTEAQLEKLVTRHEQVIAMKKALNEAKQIEAVAKTAVEALRQRKDMLVQLGAHEREELKGELIMRGREAREADAKDFLLRRAAAGNE